MSSCCRPDYGPAQPQPVPQPAPDAAAVHPRRGLRLGVSSDVSALLVSFNLTLFPSVLASLGRARRLPQAPPGCGGAVHHGGLSAWPPPRHPSPGGTGVCGVSAAQRILRAKLSASKTPEPGRGSTCPCLAPHMNTAMVGYRVEGTRAGEWTQAALCHPWGKSGLRRARGGRSSRYLWPLWGLAVRSCPPSITDVPVPSPPRSRCWTPLFWAERSPGPPEAEPAPGEAPACPRLCSREPCTPQGPCRLQSRGSQGRRGPRRPPNHRPGTSAAGAVSAVAPPLALGRRLVSPRW